MYYIGLDVHKKTISYCVKEASGHIHAEGKVGATRRELDDWMKTLPRPFLPDPKKKFYWEQFWEPLWNAASECLHEAGEVFIHGYSMPTADVRARQGT